MPELRPAAFIDRDGVINFDSAAYIKSPAEWKPIPGSLEAIARQVIPICVCNLPMALRQWCQCNRCKRCIRYRLTV